MGDAAGRFKNVRVVCGMTQLLSSLSALRRESGNAED